LFASYKTVAVCVTRAVQPEILIQSVKLFPLCSLLVFTRVGSESCVCSDNCCIQLHIGKGAGRAMPR
jgi:hypothetical protein